MHSRPLTNLALGVVLSLVGSTGLHAQTIVGYVLEQETRRPLAGAFVVLEDSAGNRHGAVLAHEDGRFALRAPAAGRYLLVTRLIGYEDAVTGPVTLEVGQTLRQTLEVPVRAVSLEDIRVEVGKRCQRRPSSDSGLAQLWDEAKKALEIAEWSQAQNVLRFHIVEHRKELDAASLRVVGIRESGKHGYFNSSPYLSRPAEELAERGYIQAAPDGEGWDHFGPDAAALLSDAFLDGHCFRVHPAADAERVGLAFEPVTGQQLPDIQGVLWLNRTTAEVERLEFTYVNLPYPHGDWSQVGGTVDFERLSTGVWIVRQWGIRMPRTAAQTGGYGGDPARLTLQTLTEQGARVMRVRTRSGEVLSEATGATLFGEVVDGTTGRGVEGAKVELTPTGRQATTGPDGTYRLAGLPGGTFRVEVTHEHLDLLGGEPVRRDVQLLEGRAARLALEAPIVELARAFCGREQGAPDPVVLYGNVRDADEGSAVPGAVVRVFGPAGESRVGTDESGRYAHCVDRADAVELAAAEAWNAFGDPDAADRLTVRSLDGALIHADLTLRSREVPTSSNGSDMAARRAHSSAVIGTVLRDDDRSPIPGAMVTVRDTTGEAVYSGVSDEHGRFRFAHPDRTTRDWRLSVEHIAYGRTEQALEFGPGEHLTVEIPLTDQAIELAPIVVRERRRGLLVDVGFYDRVESGMGIYVERGEIERRGASRLTDLMQGRSGLRVVQTGRMTHDVRVAGLQRFKGDCQPSIWVDGSLMRAGGEPRLGTGDEPLQPQLSDIIAPHLVEGVEVYTGPAGLPVQYGGSEAMCGVLVIWTRR